MLSLLFLVFIATPLVLGCLCYFVPKMLGCPKTARYLTIGYGLLVTAAGFFIAFEDMFFTKASARELIEEQGFKLEDEFKLLRNESMSGIGDYYHTFTLQISDNDKQAAILLIKSSDNYKPATSYPDDLPYHQTTDRYFGKKIIRNYETSESYVREYFEPSGRKGYAPTFRQIFIHKIKNEVEFQETD
ncbi:hypothetical protein GU926_09330 [Nibribacter ruber]|uniref:Uncharacterized protein n=1 Tax=Nibribacter ruber TaxID=2698458 RepID=A0A6P1P027_9BACT|nr:hypothetical protein [Nibribacter ruber]QHL87628.1 hypothetical protein GU926_09330 [Nibribacter ruber]